MDKDNKKGADSFKQTIANYFNTTAVTLIVGSSIVILGSFLNWIENPLVATTGIGIGLGYITIIISAFVMVLAYLNSHPNKRIILSFLSGMGLLLIALMAILTIFTEPQARVGGGLYLTLVGAVVVIVYSVKRYAYLSSQKRAAILVGGTVFAIMFVPGVVISGNIIDQYQKTQAEEDLNVLEIEQVSTYHLDEGNTSAAEIKLTNPTSSEISARIGFKSNLAGHHAGVYKVPPRETKTIVIEEDSDTMIRLSEIERGYDHRVECDFRESRWGDDGKAGFSFRYNCSPGPGYVEILPDHSYYALG